MRALLLDAEARTANVQNIPAPSPAANEILVEVKAIGLNPVDLLASGPGQAAAAPAAEAAPGALSRAAVPTDWDRRVAWWTAGQGLPGRGQRCVA